MREKDMWKRLSQLNDEFKEIKKSKKALKKCLKNNYRIFIEH